VSGASTITQQVIRNIYRFRRTIPAKIAEAWLAVRLEHTLSKGEILAQYLNRISYGRQAYGIEAASRFYFDKPALDLSPSEAAYLAALPARPDCSSPRGTRPFFEPGETPSSGRWPGTDFSRPAPFPGLWPSPSA
jgi:Membrane carboxypeptidase/penicillin-binding protein